MSDAWYEAVDADMRLTQGDLISECPLIVWRPELLQIHGTDETEVLKGATIAIRADVIVMTQACDLEYEKVTNVVLCPHLSLA